jgi:hypothetical protein
MSDGVKSRAEQLRLWEESALRQEAPHSNNDGLKERSAEYAVKFVRALPPDVPLPEFWFTLYNEAYLRWGEPPERSLALTLTPPNGLHAELMDEGESLSSDIDTGDEVVPQIVLTAIRAVVSTEGLVGDGVKNENFTIKLEGGKGSVALPAVMRTLTNFHQLAQRAADCLAPGQSVTLRVKAVQIDVEMGCD